MTPSPWKSPLRKAPSQLEPSAHSNLPFPSFSPCRYPPWQLPLLFFSTPSPSGCSLLHPPLYVSDVTSLEQVPCELVAPKKQLALGQTKMASLSSGSQFSLRWPSKQPWNSPFSLSLQICTRPLGSCSERRLSVLAQIMLQGCLIFQILLGLWGKFESFLIFSSTCLLSIGKAVTSTRSRRIRFSCPSPDTTAPATFSSSNYIFPNGSSRLAPMHKSLPIRLYTNATSIPPPMLTAVVPCPSADDDIGGG